MRKTLLTTAIMATLCSINAIADDHKVVEIKTPSTAVDSPDGYSYYIYNSQGQLMWMQSTATNTRDVYEYDTNGNKAKKSTYSWISASKEYKLLNEETYTYDAEGNIATMNQTTNIGTPYSRNYAWTYSDYENGIAKTSHMDDIRPANTYQYDYKSIFEYNANGKLTSNKVEELDYDYPEDGFCAHHSYSYTYQANGDIDSEVYTSYNYDYSKVKKTTTQLYKYADINPANTVSGLSATATGSTVNLSWNAVSGNDVKYIVIYDMTRLEVTGTSATLANLNIGDHEITVQAVVNGNAQYAATPVTVSITDPGKLAPVNFATGTPRKEIRPTDTEDRTFYIIPLTWNIPEGHSAINDIRIYYNSSSYGDTYCALGSQSATSYDIMLDENDVRKMVLLENGSYEMQDGIYITISVALVYGSGEAMSESITINPYNEVNGIIDSIESVVNKENNKPSVIYNLSGQQISVLAKGIIIKDGKKILKK